MKIEKFSVKLMLISIVAFSLSYICLNFGGFNPKPYYSSSGSAALKNLLIDFGVIFGGDFEELNLVNHEFDVSKNLTRNSRNEIELKTVCTDINFEEIASADEIRIKYNAEGDDNFDINKDLEIKLTDTKILIQTDETRKVNDSINCTGDNKIVVGYPRDILKLTVQSVSGDVIIPSLQLETASLKTVSGDLKLGDTRLSDLNLQTTSGSIEASGSITKADIKTVSGDLVLNNSVDSPNLTLQSVSGDINLRLPPSINSTFDFTSVSGDVFIDKVFSNVTQAKAGLQLTLGEGKGQVKAKTVSGDFNLTPLK